MQNYIKVWMFRYPNINLIVKCDAASRKIILIIWNLKNYLPSYWSLLGICQKSVCFIYTWELIVDCGIINKDEWRKMKCTVSEESSPASCYMCVASSPASCYMCVASSPASCYMCVASSISFSVNPELQWACRVRVLFCI